MNIEKLCQAVEVFYKIAQDRQQASGVPNPAFDQMKPVLLEKMKSALEKWRVGIQDLANKTNSPVALRISVYMDVRFNKPVGQVLQNNEIVQSVEMKDQPDYFRLENGRYVPRKREELTKEEVSSVDMLFGQIMHWGKIGFNFWGELDQNTIQQLSTILKESQGPIQLMFPETGPHGPALGIDVRPMNPQPPQPQQR